MTRRLVVDLRDARPVWAVPDTVVDRIRGALPDDWEMRVVSAPADGRGDGGAPSPEAVEAVRGAEVYFGYGLPRALWEPATAPPDGRLRWVHSAAAGVRGSLYPAMRDSDILLTNSAGVHAPPMAETVLGMILHFARGLDFAVRAQHERRWDKEPFERADTPVREIAGTTLGILGYGGIGREIARRALPLGMRALALRRSRTGDEPGVEMLHGPDGLAELLRRSDYLAVTLPETPETTGLIGERELAMLPPGAVLINVARGGILDQDALVRALRGGHLRGAALDVSDPEPLPPESPLWDAPGVLVMPHVSATSRGFWDRELALMLDNLDRYLAGRPLRNVVDKERGY